MNTNVWGPCVWRGAVHMIALGYPEKPTTIDKSTYKTYYTELWKVLPCGKCSVNYKRHLEELPIDNFLDSRKELFEWTVRLHNIVNRELGKPEYTVEQAFDMYIKKKDTMIWVGTAVFAVLIVLLFFMRKISR